MNPPESDRSFIFVIIALRVKYEIVLFRET